MATKLKEFATTPVAVVELETSARVVAQLMRRHHIGALVVVDALDKNKPVGIVTDRDLVLELMAEGLDPAVFTAGDIMSVDLVTADPAMDAMDAVQLMRKYRLRRLVVTDTDGRLKPSDGGLSHDQTHRHSQGACQAGPVAQLD